TDQSQRIWKPKRTPGHAKSGRVVPWVRQAEGLSQEDRQMPAQTKEIKEKACDRLFISPFGTASSHYGQAKFRQVFHVDRRSYLKTKWMRVGLNEVKSLATKVNSRHTTLQCFRFASGGHASLKSNESGHQPRKRGCSESNASLRVCCYQ